METTRWDMGLIEIWGGTTNWQFQLANFLTMMFDQLICTLFTDKHMLGSRQAKFVAETILCDMGIDQSLLFHISRGEHTYIYISNLFCSELQGELTHTYWQGDPFIILHLTSCERIGIRICCKIWKAEKCLEEQQAMRGNMPHVALLALLLL